MARTPYRSAVLLFQNCRSDTCVQARASLCIAASHLSFAPGLSKDTPSMVKFLPLNILKVFTTLGFSLRQGPHHDAQKSISTYFPLNEARLITLPLVSAS